MKDLDGQSDGTRSARSCLSGSARVRKLYTLRRAKQDLMHEPSQKVPATKPRAAWTDHAPVWLADDFLAPTDRYIFGEVDRPPPDLNEDPPDRSLMTHRDFMAARERRNAQENRERLGEFMAKSRDFTRLPRRGRIQLLESLEKDEISSWPGPDSFRRQELRPMRHVSVQRARCEWAIRRQTHHGPSAPDETSKMEGPMHPPEVEMLDVSCGPGEIFPENVDAKKAVRILSKAAPERPPSENWWLQKRSKEEEALQSKTVTALIEELGKMVASTFLDEEDATHLARLGRALEEHCYKLRLKQLIPALLLLSRAWKILEAEAEPVVEHTLVVREHWRRMSKELQISADSMAEAVSSNSRTAHLPNVTAALQALAESETCGQERLDAQLARLKELFRKESICSKDLAKIAGAVGTARLAGAYSSQGFLEYFNAVLLEHLIEFREEEFHSMGWIFPTACMTSNELQQVLARAAEIQVGLLPNSVQCLGMMRKVADFVVLKAPQLYTSLNAFLQLYCQKLRDDRSTAA